MLQKSLWTLNILGNVLVAWHFYSTGLHRIYRFFFFSIVLALLRSAGLYRFEPKSVVLTTKVFSARDDFHAAAVS
jgi:hypothetical protein